MVDVQHEALGPADGIHTIVDAVVANQAARVALTWTIADLGKIAYQTDTRSFWAIRDNPAYSGFEWYELSTVALAVLVAAKADKLTPSATRADAAYTFVLADADLDLQFPFTVDRTVTIPAGIFAVGQWLTGVSSGAGRALFVAGSGTTLTSFTSTFYTRAAGSPWALYQRALNTWELYGDLYL